MDIHTFHSNKNIKEDVIYIYAYPVSPEREPEEIKKFQGFLLENFKFESDGEINVRKLCTVLKKLKIAQTSYNNREFCDFSKKIKKIEKKFDEFYENLKDDEEVIFYYHSKPQIINQQNQFVYFHEDNPSYNYFLTNYGNALKLVSIIKHCGNVHRREPLMISFDADVESFSFMPDIYDVENLEVIDQPEKEIDDIAEFVNPFIEIDNYLRCKKL